MESDSSVAGWTNGRSEFVSRKTNIFLSSLMLCPQRFCDPASLSILNVPDTLSPR